MKKHVTLSIYLLAAIAVLVFCIVAIPRFLYPYEVHWLEGTLVDEIGRILSNKPLYAKPSMEYVPWLYGPGYFYVAAAICKLTGLSFITARLPSLLATIGTIGLIYYVLRRETQSVIYGIAGVGLYLASYVKTELNMLLARVDALFIFLVLTATVCVYYSRSWRSVAMSVFIIVAAYFTKQTSIFFAISLGAYFLFIARWKHAIFFILTTGTLIFLGTAFLDLHYEGWFSFYTIEVVREGKVNAVGGSKEFLGFIEFAVLRCWPITCACLYFFFRELWVSKDSTRIKSTTTYFGLFFLVAAVVGLLGILNQGGNHNVLLPMAAGCAMFLPLVLYKNKSIFKGNSQWLLPIQLLLLLSYPWSSGYNIATDNDRIRQEEFNNSVASLQGDVWIPFHGYVWRYTNKRPFADINAMRDVLQMQNSIAHHLQDEYTFALQSHRFSYIISDIKYPYPYYTLLDSMLNTNRVWMTLISDSNGGKLLSPYLYRYTPMVE